MEKRCIKRKNTNKYKLEQKTNSSQNYYVEGKNESGSVIIKDESSKNELNVTNIVEETGTMINVDKNINMNSIKSRNDEEQQGSIIIKKTEKINDDIDENDNEDQLKKMIDLYGIDGLSFEYNNNPDKTIKAEETKMVEQRENIEKNEINIENTNKNMYENQINNLSDLINDTSVNSLTSNELKSKILTLEEEMKNEKRREEDLKKRINQRELENKKKHDLEEKRLKEMQELQEKAKQEEVKKRQEEKLKVEKRKLGKIC